MNWRHKMQEDLDRQRSEARAKARAQRTKDLSVPMSVTEVREEVARISSLECPETKHIDEDRLFERLLRMAADGHNIQERAKEALKLKEADYRRYYA
jgi:hypothetical protein